MMIAVSDGEQRPHGGPWPRRVAAQSDRPSPEGEGFAQPDHPDYICFLMKVEEIGTLEAKTNLSALLNQVLEGKSFSVTRRGKRIAELRPIAPPPRTPRAGFAKGTFTYIALDFDAPLDDFADYR